MLQMKALIVHTTTTIPTDKLNYQFGTSSFTPVNTSSERTPCDRDPLIRAANYWFPQKFALLTCAQDKVFRFSAAMALNDDIVCREIRKVSLLLIRCSCNLLSFLFIFLYWLGHKHHHPAVCDNWINLSVTVNGVGLSDGGFRFTIKSRRERNKSRNKCWRT